MSEVKMTRAHYQFIADRIREAREAAEYMSTTRPYKLGYEVGLEMLAKDTASALAATNPKFDRDKFLAACDPAGGYRNKKPMGNGSKR